MTVFKATLLSLRSFLSTIIIYFLIFAIFAIVRAKVSYNTTADLYKDTSLDVAVLDLDNSQLSNALIDYLDSSQKITKLDSNNEDINYQAINDNIRFEIYDYAIIIPTDFSEAIISGDYQDKLEYLASANSASGYLISEKINTFLSDVKTYLDCGYSEEDAIKISLEQVEKTDIVDTKIYSNDSYNSVTNNASISYSFVFSAYSCLMILTVCIASVLGFLKNKDSKDRISVSGKSFASRNNELILAVFLIGLGITLCFFIYSAILGRKQPDFHMLLFYGINEFFLMLLGLGIAYFICSITSNTNLINMLSNMIVLSLSFLCGVFVPSEFMSEAVVKFSQLLPVYWFVDCCKYIEHHDFSNILSLHFFECLLIQLVYAIIFFVAGIIINKKREQYAY